METFANCVAEKFTLELYPGAGALPLFRLRHGPGPAGLYKGTDIDMGGGGASPSGIDVVGKITVVGAPCDGMYTVDKGIA